MPSWLWTEDMAVISTPKYSIIRSLIRLWASE